MTPKTAPTTLTERFQRVRDFSQTLIETLTPEDCVIQSMPDVSPLRWHLAHTSWFFETFVLSELPGFEPFDQAYALLFNSYYNSIGEQFPRPHRGLLSRPGLQEILAYRQRIDEQMQALLERGELDERQRGVVEVGLQHEQQHQELMLTDIKHVFSCNPLWPVYRSARWDAVPDRASRWLAYDENLYWLGHEGPGFAFDNELPRHQSFVPSFELRNTLVTCGEYQEFMRDAGYQRPELWLSLGWHHVQQDGWQAPEYWVPRDEQWFHFTLAGLVPVDPRRPVCHLSYFEADAFARWAGARLPTEAEWEVAAAESPVQGRFAEDLIAAGLAVHPSATQGLPTGGPPVRAQASSLGQIYGEAWEWTSSAYAAYPGYRAAAGALGEYNGKFMCNQFVLRGGSCATPAADHIRVSYRNFFPPETRWQFAGLRLCRDAE